jgi:hypothetical protein
MVGRFEIAAVLAAIAVVGYVLTETWYQTRYNEACNVFWYNYVKDPSFGFEIMQRLHLLSSAQVWDWVSFMTWNYVNIDGIVFQEFPEPGYVQPINDGWQVAILNNACYLWIANYGANNWVQWGPYTSPA